MEVQFKNTRKGYYRNSLRIPLEIGDVVAVEASPGHDIGTVTLTGKLVEMRLRKSSGRGGVNMADIPSCSSGSWFGLSCFDMAYLAKLTERVSRITGTTP